MEEQQTADGKVRTRSSCCAEAEKTPDKVKSSMLCPGPRCPRCSGFHWSNYQLELLAAGRGGGRRGGYKSW